MYCTEVKHLFRTLPLVAMPVRIFPKTNGQGGFFPCAVQSSSGGKILNIYVCALESNTLGDVLQLVQLF